MKQDKKEGIVITGLAQDQIDEAVEVMLTAFIDEALTSSWLDLTDSKLNRAYAIIVKIIHTIHLDAGDPIYAALEKGRVVGIAGVTTPDANKNKLKAGAMFIRNLPRLLPLIPSVLRAVRMLYRATKPPAGLPKRYCTLEILAVAPGYQGRGIASRLIKEMHLNHLGAKDYSGIYLLTGEDKNVKIYERFGYRVVDKRVLEKVTAYHMFRAKD